MDKLKGFSLIELLIVVTIIGILATVGIPAYNKQVDAAKRSDGKATLMAIQSKMERYIFDNNTYTGWYMHGYDTIEKLRVDYPLDSEIKKLYEVTFKKS